MDTLQKQALTKVPQVTLIFWLVKILATTLGETAGDALSMSLNLGYLVSSVIFIGLFAIVVAIQIRSKQYSSSIYWATIIATTTAGTTMADFADRLIRHRLYRRHIVTGELVVYVIFNLVRQCR